MEYNGNMEKVYGVFKIAQYKGEEKLLGLYSTEASANAAVDTLYKNNTHDPTIGGELMGIITYKIKALDVTTEKTDNIAVIQKLNAILDTLNKANQDGDIHYY